MSSIRLGISVLACLALVGCAESVETPHLDETPPTVTVALSWGARVSEGEILDEDVGFVIVRSADGLRQEVEIPRRLVYNLIVTASDGGGIRRMRVGRARATFQINNPNFVGEWDENDQLNLRQFGDFVRPNRNDETDSFVISVQASDFGDVEGPAGRNSVDLEITFEMQEQE